MKILKFGGSSVKDAERIKIVISIVNKLREQEPIAVVVSALGGITDQLIETAKKAERGDDTYKEGLAEIHQRHLETIDQLITDPTKNAETRERTEKKLKELKDQLHGVFLIKELSTKGLDFVSAFGERLSAYIISQAFHDAEYLDARKIIKTDKNFGSAMVDFEKTNDLIKQYFDSHQKLQIVTGFISSTIDNETITLGRGGSDYTASILGAALSASEIQIWTDVNGVLTADPRKVEKTFPLDTMTYNEAMEMSHFGAKVIYSPTMQPAKAKNVPLRIKNTFNPEHPGTYISHEKSAEKGYPIKGISSIGSVALLRLQGSGLVGVAGIAKRLFSTLAEAKINIILISQASSEHSICFAITPEDAEKAKQIIEDEFHREIDNNQVEEVIIENEMSIIAVIGENMCQRPGIAGRVFYSLGKHGINISAIAQGSSELNISIVVHKKDEQKALRALHSGIFYPHIKQLNIFMVGTGLVGKTLLQQIAAKKNDEIKIIALANSRKMLFQEEGIDLSNWQQQLDNSQDQGDLEHFVKKMRSLNLPNSIFVDCTAAEQPGQHYEEILNSAISVVTPNKKANSGSLEYYNKLQKAADNAHFYYETNVGAGLPVISTLKDLQKSGDKITKIQAVLSGTLSYIFNSFTGEKSFSQVVKEAQEKGYTEPDPRDDLNGIDVARKILILARETGLTLELSDIDIQNLVPPSCRDAQTIEEFFTYLKEADSEFTELLKQAQAENKKLCYIATLEDGKAQVSLQAVDANHPFYSLSGSDNIISFSSERYHDRPLVVKGPGAGAEVTAAGVFADIFKIENACI